MVFAHIHMFQYFQRLAFLPFFFLHMCKFLGFFDGCNKFLLQFLFQLYFIPESCPFPASPLSWSDFSSNFEFTSNLLLSTTFLLESVLTDVFPLQIRSLSSSFANSDSHHRLAKGACLRASTSTPLSVQTKTTSESCL